MQRIVAESPLRKSGVVALCSLWLVIAGWNLVDLLRALDDPGVTVDATELVVLLACAAIALPVGVMAGVLLVWLPAPPRTWDVQSQVAVLMMFVSVAAMAAVQSLGATLAGPGLDDGFWGPRIAGAWTGLFLGLGLGFVATSAWRRLEVLSAAAVVQPPEPQTLRR